MNEFKKAPSCGTYSKRIFFDLNDGSYKDLVGVFLLVNQNCV